MMNATEMKNTARNTTAALLTEILVANDAVQFADGSWAILQNIDGQEIWTEISVKSKAYKATKVAPAFDPFVAAQEWQDEKAQKAAEKERKAAEKALKMKVKE